MKYRLLLLSFLVVLAVTLVSLFTIHAQNVNKGLIVYPVNFDLTYANQPTVEKISVLNNYDQTATIKVNLRNFTATGEEGGVALTPENTNFSLASWISVDHQTAIIPAHKTEVFTFTVTPPKNAEPGGHFGSIVFSTIPNAQIKGTAGAVISQEVASLILYRIQGNTDEKAVVESFASDKSFYEFGPVTFTTRVKNNGQVHVAPSGEIVIRGTFGDVYTANLQPRYVLPNAIRQVPAILNKKILLGKYTATLIADYGTKNQQLSAYTEFYAFPVRYGAIVFGVLLLLFIVRKRLGKALRALITGK